MELIEQGPDGVRVGANGLVVSARRAVVAMPPALTRIRLSPNVTAKRDQLAQWMASGALTKCTAVYETPFWREDGWSGAAVSDEGPVETTLDNSPPEGSPGVMLGFIAEPRPSSMPASPESERRRIALDCFARMWGEGARGASAYFEQAWADEEWSGGGPVSTRPPASSPPTARSCVAPRAASTGPGSETATVWCGYMDGAVRSGERAAGEVLDAEGWRL